MNIHDLYRPFLRYFRKKRMSQFREYFKITSNTQILDVGGTHFNWTFLPEKPDLVLMNIHKPKVEDRGLSWIIADGRRMPFRDRAFEIVYSNSVIEHLEAYDNQHQFAQECARVGAQFFIQTPNRRFLVEPHLITPFIHWLPVALQKHLIRNFTIWGLVTRPDKQRAETFLNEIRLLDFQDMVELFPDAKIWRERVLGYTKSFIAVRRFD